MFDDNAKFKLNDFITFSEIEENGKKEIVIYHGDNETYYSLNAMGTNILKMIHEDNLTFSQMVKDITGVYKVDENIAQKDVESMIKDLIEEKIISLINE
ncbi:PqqD family protein [bacterium]|nr:PqqD family protein [bacterium]